MWPINRRDTTTRIPSLLLNLNYRQMKTATRELALIILMMSAQICTLQAACRKSSLTNTLHAYGQPTFQPSDKSLQVAHHQQQQQLSNIRLRRQATTSAHQPVNMKQEIINYSNATSEHITTAHNRTSALNITQEHTAATTPSMNSTQTPATTKHSVARDAKEIDKLRLEYFKFRILSQLGIAHNPDQMAPKLDDGLRRELSSDALLADEAAQQTSRHKRSLACHEVKSSKNACCLEPFYVNFTEIGWDKWIIYPTGYQANYCRGQCDLSHARYYHSTLLSKFSNVIGMCCSPRQMAPLRLLYIDEDNKVHQKSMPDMVVESCDCA